jgi:hypothetical protein
MTKKIFQIIGRLILSVLVDCRLNHFLSKLILKEIQEISAQGNISRVDRNNPVDPERISILVLSPKEYRGRDLLVLAQNSEVQILTLPDHWTTRLFYRFVSSKINMKNHIPTQLNPERGSSLAISIAKYRDFLGRLLPVFYSLLRVDCVLSAHHNFVTDANWGAVSESVGVPYIVLHREGEWFDKGHPVYDSTFDAMKKRMGGYKFEGSLVLFHNQLGRNSYADFGMIPLEKSAVIGALRMDELATSMLDADSDIPANDTRWSITLFPFFVAEKFPAYDVFQDFLITISTIARDNPSLKFLIKPKGPERQFNPWLKLANDTAIAHGINLADYPNLEIDYDIDAQKAIQQSSVVCGLNSTTILEAGAAGKPVIIPSYGSLLKPKCRNQLIAIPEYSVYDIVHSKEELRSKLLEKMEDPFVPVEIREKRRKVLEKYCGQLDGKIVDLFVEKVRECVSNKPPRAT